jgi:hypothetical protein
VHCCGDSCKPKTTAHFDHSLAFQLRDFVGPEKNALAERSRRLPYSAPRRIRFHISRLLVPSPQIVCSRRLHHAHILASYLQSDLHQRGKGLVPLREILSDRYAIVVPE